MWSFYIILLARSVLQNFFSCFGFWLIFVVLCGRNKNYNQHKDFRAIWFGWELRFLVQIPAQRKVGGEVRAGCSGFPPLWCWKPPRMETSLGSLFQHYTIINLCILKVEKLLLHAVWSSRFSWCLVSLGLPSCTAVKSFLAHLHAGGCWVVTLRVSFPQADPGWLP